MLIRSFIMKLQIVILTLTVYFGSISGMTRLQLKKTMTVMKNQCIPKIGVSEEKVAKIEQGDFREDHDVMCYIACVYKTVNVVKNNRLDGAVISKQIDILYPQEMKENVKRGVVLCMPIQDKYSDMCEGIFHAAKCLYEYDPSSFIFP